MDKTKFLDTVNTENPSWMSSKDSFIDVAIVTSIGPFSLLIRSYLLKKLNITTKINHFVLDCMCLVVPITFGFTLLSSALPNIIILLAVLVIIALNNQPSHTQDSLYPFRRISMPYLNTYRALVTLCTIVVILAVDFPQLFPQHFHKRYTRGFSVMDTGVGSFIFSHAIIAPEARYKPSTSSRIQKIVKTLVSSSALLVLGCARLFVTWITNYTVSEEEYGKHWNFFFTLACVKLLVTVTFCILPNSIVSYSWIIGLIIGCLYQSLLSVYDYKDWIIVGDEGNGDYTGNFINANRPGIFSTLGYCSLYFFGVQLGRYLFSSKSIWRDQYNCFMRLASIVVIFGICTFYLNEHIDRSSRMIANLTFVCWQITHNTCLLLCSFVVDLLCAARSTDEDPIIPGQCTSCVRYLTDRPADADRSPCSCLISAVNKNQLFFFLIGNVFTGIVNICIKTGSVPVPVAVGILLFYGVSVTGLTTLLHVFNISTKFW